MVPPHAQQQNCNRTSSSSMQEGPREENTPSPPIPRREGTGTCPTQARGETSLLTALLGSVLRTRLLAVRHALRVEHAADDMVAHAGKVADAAAAHEHD